VSILAFVKVCEVGRRLEELGDTGTESFWSDSFLGKIWVQLFSAVDLTAQRYEVPAMSVCLLAAAAKA
jgi:hypothetical protein